jgi:heme-degrading monooxygenase HmoA
MMVILFRSKLTDTAGDDYVRMADEMEAHARSFPGFVDVKAFEAEDGERLTVVWCSTIQPIANAASAYWWKHCES